MDSKKRYLVHHYPEDTSGPKPFRTTLGAFIHAVLWVVDNDGVCDLEDTKTGEYTPYWV